MKLRKSHLEKAKLEDVVRLCRYLEIDERSDFKLSSMINWLIWMGYCEDPNLGAWRN